MTEQPRLGVPANVDWPLWTARLAGAVDTLLNCETIGDADFARQFARLTLDEYETTLARAKAANERENVVPIRRDPAQTFLSQAIDVVCGENGEIKPESLHHSLYEESTGAVRTVRMAGADGPRKEGL